MFLFIKGIDLGIDLEGGLLPDGPARRACLSSLRSHEGRPEHDNMPNMKYKINVCIHGGYLQNTEQIKIFPYQVSSQCPHLSCVVTPLFLTIDYIVLLKVISHFSSQRKSLKPDT